MGMQWSAIRASTVPKELFYSLHQTFKKPILLTLQILHSNDQQNNVKGPQRNHNRIG